MSMKTSNSRRSLTSNYAYLLRRLTVADKNIVGICALMVLTGLGVPLLNVLFPKMVTWAALREPISWSLVLGIIVGFCFLSGTCGGIRNYFDRRNGVYLVNFGFILREDIQELSMTMPFPRTEDPKTLSDIKLAENCTTQVQPMVETFCRCISAGLLLISYAVMIARLSMLILLFFVLCVLVDALVMQKSKRYETSLWEPLANTNRKKDYLFRTMFDYRFGKELRIFALRDILIEKFNRHKEEQCQLNTQAERRKTLSQAVEALFILVCEAAIYYVLLTAFLQGTLAVDDFVLYTGLAVSFHVISRGLVADLMVLFALNVSIQDYRGLVEEGRETFSGTRPCASTGSIPSIAFECVSFRYPNTDRYILRDLSFTIEAGAHVSIVGLNGAGKSTIVKLICRFYRPESGRILLDGTDIWTYDAGEYGARIAAVFQESKLFACTLKENICLQEEPDLPRMWDALEAVGMAEKVRGLPEREDSNVLKYLYEDGLEFSGGETQRLCIARAVYKQGDVLLLDEPTAALDALAEKSIYERFSQVSQGKTTVFISHRLNSNRFCDKVVYLEDGRAADQGSHEQLMERCERYRELYLMQASHYQTRKGTGQ